jgi:hypothetical protein
MRGKCGRCIVAQRYEDGNVEDDTGGCIKTEGLFTYQISESVMFGHDWQISMKL